MKTLERVFTRSEKLPISKIESAIFSIRPVLKSIQGDIVDNYYPEFTWTNGGCFSFAEAIVEVLKDAELWVVAEKTEDDWGTHHCFFNYNGAYFDYDGIVTEEWLLKKYGHGESKIGKVEGWKDLWYPDQEFVLLSEMKEIGREFSKYI